MKKQWFLLAFASLLVLGVFGLGLTSAVGGQEAQSAAADAPPPEVALTDEPVPFPHNVHAGEYQIDCQYCHFSAERSNQAGIPPMSTCMGCHLVIAGEERAADITRLREYYNRGEAISWNRIYKVADHVQFPHLRHIAGGVQCSTCHGNVQEIGVLQELNQDLSMGWCLNCHIEMGASRDCTVCHY